jgi:hypothetical protein
MKAETIRRNFIRLSWEAIPQPISLQKNLSVPLVLRLKFNQASHPPLISNKFRDRVAKELILAKVAIDQPGPNTPANNRHNLLV